MYVCTHAHTEDYELLLLRVGNGGGGGERNRDSESERGGGAVCTCYAMERRGQACLLSSQPLLPRSLPPQLQSITNPLPPFPKAAGLQTVRVQSDSGCGPMHGG